MTSLHSLQSLFYDAVFERDPEDSAVTAVSLYINATPGLSAREHFNIYRGSIMATLNRALHEIFPVCSRLVGERFFNRMGREYMCQQPSLSADLAEYGHNFTEFISGFEPASGLPYLPDVARLELAWHKAFHAAAETGVDLDTLINIPESDKPGIVFHLPGSASLISSRFPIHRIWQVNQPDYTGDDQVKLDEGGIKLLVWRQAYDVRIDLLDDIEWDILKEIGTGKTLQRLCTILSQQGQALDIEKILPILVKTGHIASFSIEP